MQSSLRHYAPVLSAYSPLGEGPLDSGDAKWPPYRMEHFEQPVDHFNMLNSNRTFLQRYLREDSNFTKNGPIFAFTGAEGGDVPRFYTAYNTPIGLARRLGGMIIFMEMRFYGTSDTFNDTATECRGDVEELCPSANRLGLLSIEQGTLAALMRLRAPWLVDMAWASSSPLLGFDGMAGISQYAWRERITTNWRELAAPPDRGGGHPTGEACVRAVRAGFAALQVAAPNASRVAQAFNVCEGTSSDDVAARIEGLAWGILEGEGTHSYPPALSHIPGRCRAMLAAAADATRAASRAAEGRNASSAADGLATDGVAPPGGSAEDAGLGIFKALLEWRPSPSPPKCLNMSSGGGPSRNGVAWDYLACTEVLHPIGSNNVTDFFPPSPWAVPLIADQCRNEFAPVLTPRPHWLPTQFGLYDRRRFARAASRILFTYGSRDPWATLGVGFSSLSPTLPVLAIPNGSHCADMTGDRPTDTPQMLEARQKAFALLTGWIRAHAATKHEN